MADPIFIACPVDTWTKIATAVTAGQIWKHSSAAFYLHTYRLTGEAAPTLASDGEPIFTSGISEIINSGQLIDVYIMALSQDGKVRVDL